MAAVLTDLHWLIHQGHVIEFANGTLETAKKPLPRPPQTRAATSRCCQRGRICPNARRRQRGRGRNCRAGGRASRGDGRSARRRGRQHIAS
jgi:hypothetical protein